jgi:hypothetical protein
VSENAIWASFNERCKKLTSYIRKRLHSAQKDSMVNDSIKHIARTTSRLQGVDNFTWKEVYASTPQIFASTIYLFLLYLPEDFKLTYGLDVSENRSRLHSSTTYYDDPLTQVIYPISFSYSHSLFLIL